jgi:hypothetical protein
VLIADVAYELVGKLCTIAGALRAIHANSNIHVRYSCTATARLKHRTKAPNIFHGIYLCTVSYLGACGGAFG